MGKDDQVASSVLSTLTNWTSTHKLSGVAYVALRLKWDQDIFWQYSNDQSNSTRKKSI